MDPYRKHQFVHGHTITPEEMQDIDNGIDAVNKEATRLEAAKVNNVEGMGLSKNNYSDEDKQKVQNAATTENVSKLENEVERHAFGEQSGSRNLWDEKTESGYISTSGAEVEESASIRGANFRECKPSTPYYGVSVNRKALNLAWYDSSKTFISRVNAVNTSVTSPSNARYFKPSLNDYGAVYNHDIAIIEGTSGTYEPYIASNAQLTESEEKSEVRDAELRVLGWNVPSGMTLKNTVENGVFKQKVGRVYLPSLTFSVPTWGIYALISNAKATANNVKANAYCSKYDAQLSRVDVGYSEPYTAVGIGFDGQYLFIANPSFGGKSSSAIQAELNGMYAYYELAEYKTNTLADYPSTDIKSAELQALGWFVPSEMPVKNSFAGGVLTQYVGRVDLGSLTWTKSSNYFSTHVSGKASGNNFMASDYTTGKDTSWSTIVNKEAKGSSSSDSFVVRDDSYSDASAFKSAMSGRYLYYELATPLAHRITDMPSQKSMISDEWDSTRTYTVGAYCIYQNRLYKALIANVGQNPLTATSYWQMVKVTDIVGSGGGGTGAWTEIGTKTGTAQIAINASAFKEFFIKTQYNTVQLNHMVVSPMMSDTEVESVEGTYASAQYHKESSIKYTNSYIKLSSFDNNGSNVTNNATITVYAR